MAAQQWNTERSARRTVSPSKPRAKPHPLQMPQSRSHSRARNSLAPPVENLKWIAERFTDAPLITPGDTRTRERREIASNVCEWFAACPRAEQCRLAWFDLMALENLDAFVRLAKHTHAHSSVPLDETYESYSKWLRKTHLWPCYVHCTLKNEPAAETTRRIERALAAHAREKHAPVAVPRHVVAQKYDDDSDTSMPQVPPSMSYYAPTADRVTAPANARRMPRRYAAAGGRPPRNVQHIAPNALQASAARAPRKPRADLHGTSRRAKSHSE